MKLEYREPQPVGKILEEIMNNLKTEKYVQDKDKTLLRSGTEENN